MTTDQIIELIDSGMDLAAINSDKRTRQPIPLQKLEVLMRRSGMGIMLDAIADDGQTPAEIKTAIAEFQAFIASPRQTVLGTHEADIAAQTAAVLALVVAANPEASALVEQVYALGGGLLVDAPVSQEAYDAALAKIGRRDLFTAAMEQMQHRHAEEITALEAWYDTGDGDAPVIDEDDE